MDPLSTAIPGSHCTHRPNLSLTGSPVFLSILISVTGYRAGAIRVVNPTAPTVLSGFTESTHNGAILHDNL